MPDDVKEAVKRTFGAHAANYVTSTVHARGTDLPLLSQIAGLTGREQVLDVATAAGHTALALAPYASHVTGVDLTTEMVAQAREHAHQLGVANVAFTEGDAEHLPFPDSRFDLVTCRIAAHHFPDAAAFCQEASRVLRPGGLLMVIDNVAPDEHELDEFINSVEKLRDPSHFRAHREAEWGGYFRAAGLAFSVAHRFTTPVDREDWMARVSVPPEVAAIVRGRLANASPRVREVFAVTATHFQLYKSIMLGQKSGSALALTGQNSDRRP